ncbi:MAG: hypothetical protein J0L73_08820 [Verrucomicrobia bacterium]|nr:hypothetical protein [Verrucomicrobiota bacterium]
MKFRGHLFWLCTATVAIFLAYASWVSVTKYQHRIMVLLPDGTMAPNPTVILDYDPVYRYQPTRLKGSQYGIVFIPPAHAYGRGWEVMKIHASVGTRNYVAARKPAQCLYPMTVVLTETPGVPERGVFQQLRDLTDLVKQVLK